MTAEGVDERVGLAVQAYVYGFAPVFNLEQVERFITQGLGSVPAVPFNVISHARSLAGPEEEFVSINNDTVYSIANLDASGGPIRLDVPDTHGRYYVLQFVDAWRHFAYVGHRATGTDAGSFLLVAPDWRGDPPADATVIRLPTAVATMVGRWAVNGEADLPAVHALQDQLRLTPTGNGHGLPQPDPAVPEDVVFFERLRVAMQAFPPAPRDLDYQRQFEPLGLLAAQSRYAEPESDLVGILRAAIRIARERIEQALRSADVPMQNGWSLTYHAFDYNLDFFEIGALDDDRWKLPDTPERYGRRALAARGGLWGNHGYEAAYTMIYVDSDGNALDGGQTYELRFSTPPPCRAFWSVTMYDASDFYLVPNAIDRYSIGDRTQGLHRADDGSLTVVMQRHEPAEPERRANWLPTPDGAYRPLLRMYEPDDAVFDGSYELPAIRRLS